MLSRLYRKLSFGLIRITLKQNHMFKRNHPFIKTICRSTFLLIIPLLVIITGFTSLRNSNSSGINEPVTLSGYMPLYKMKPAVVDEIISGLPLDKRIIFQFVTNGSATSDVKVLWYKASGMENHAEGRTPTELEMITGTTAITFGETAEFILANNYLFVKIFKSYVRSLAANYEYIEFKPVKNTTNNHVFFQIHAVYTFKNAKAAGYPVEVNDVNSENLTYVDQGIESQPSPPANTGGN